MEIPVPSKELKLRRCRLSLMVKMCRFNPSASLPDFLPRSAKTVCKFVPHKYTLHIFQVYYPTNIEKISEKPMYFNHNIAKIYS